MVMYSVGLLVAGNPVSNPSLQLVQQVRPSAAQWWFRQSCKLQWHTTQIIVMLIVVQPIVAPQIYRKLSIYLSMYKAPSNLLAMNILAADSLLVYHIYTQLICTRPANIQNCLPVKWSSIIMSCIHHHACSQSQSKQITWIKSSRQYSWVG